MSEQTIQRSARELQYKTSARSNTKYQAAIKYFLAKSQSLIKSGISAGDQLLNTLVSEKNKPREELSYQREVIQARIGHFWCGEQDSNGLDYIYPESAQKAQILEKMASKQTPSVLEDRRQAKDPALTYQVDDEHNEKFDNWLDEVINFKTTPEEIKPDLVRLYSGYEAEQQSEEQFVVEDVSEPDPDSEETLKSLKKRLYDGVNAHQINALTPFETLNELFEDTDDVITFTETTEEVSVSEQNTQEEEVPYLGVEMPEKTTEQTEAVQGDFDNFSVDATRVHTDLSCLAEFGDETVSPVATTVFTNDFIDDEYDVVDPAQRAVKRKSFLKQVLGVIGGLVENLSVSTRQIEQKISLNQVNADESNIESTTAFIDEAFTEESNMDNFLETETEPQAEPAQPAQPMDKNSYLPLKKYIPGDAGEESHLAARAQFLSDSINMLVDNYFEKSSAEEESELALDLNL